MIDPSPALAGEGLGTAADRKLSPRRQVQLSAFWLAGSLLANFLISLIFDVAIIIIEPIVLLASGIAWFILMARGMVMARKLRHSKKRAAIAGLAAFIALALLLAGFIPTLRAGGDGKAYIVLLLNSAKYERFIARPDPPSIYKQRAEWVSVGGDGEHRIFAFGYGGFLSIDRDIVYDPADRPESDATALLHASTAGCRWLRGHYYDCTLDF